MNNTNRANKKPKWKLYEQDLPLFDCDLSTDLPGKSR